MTLYEMLTLRPAFDDANHARLIQRIGHEDPRRPRKLAPHIPRDLETIVLKAGARDPADRYATAEALAEDLRRFLSDRPIQARRHAAAERLWRWCRRNPAIAGAIGVIAASLIVVASVSFWAAISSNASKRDALEQLWRSKLSEARATVLSRQPGQRFTSLTRIREALAIATQLGMTEEDRLALRNAAIAALALPDFEVDKEWDCPAGTSAIDFDAALDKYALADKDGNVSIRRVSDDRELFALPGLGEPVIGRFSPSGRYLVVYGSSDVGNGPMQLWQLDLPEPRCTLKHPRAYGEFSSDGGWLAHVTPTQLTILDLATNKIKRTWELPGSGRCGIRWSPQGDRLAVVRAVNGKWLVEVRQAATGAVVGSLWHDRSCESIAWHPDGRLLAAGAGTNIHLWDVAEQARVAVLEGHKGYGIRLEFNRAGDRLISSDWHGTLRLWDVATGRQRLSVLGVGWPTFGLDDCSLACTLPGSGKVQILRFAAGREVRTLAGRVTAGIPSPSFSADLSRDGQLVALHFDDRITGAAKGLAVLDRRTGRELGRLSASQRSLGFQQDGSFWTWNGAGDVLRWPSKLGLPSGTIRFGPPKPVVSFPGTEARAMTADGRSLVLGNFYQGALILHRGPRERLIPTGPQDDVRYGAISPDGRWVATGSHWCHSGIGVKVWHAATGRLQKQFTVRDSSKVRFSPDGRWLLAGWTSSIKFWRTGNWEEGPPLYVQGDGGGAAFSPDSRLLAVGGLGRVRLVRPDTGAEVARLTFAEQTSLVPLSFTPDGAELLVHGEDTQAIHIWDLRLIRAQLAELGLDWDDPLLPPASQQPDVPRAVEFVGAELLADAQKLRQYRMTLNLLALSANPFEAQAHFRLAQITDDPGAAIAHYTASLALQPDQPLAYENRAVAAFKLKRWSQVVADADQVLKDHPDRIRALHWRAVAYQRLGQHAKAIADLTAALLAFPRDCRLCKLRAESYEALGDKALAAADRQKVEELAPDNPNSLNTKARLLLTGPPAQRDAEAAVKLAQRAVELVPNEARYVNTLGVAQYRTGQWVEARAALERSLALGDGRWDAFDLFFLAMCHHKLGQPEQAKDCFDRAVSWVAGRKGLFPGHVEELRAFKAEAEAEAELKAPAAKK
jgi:WD40 repeat protein/tetratricopeptide (TPR) repeat protein